MKTSALQQLIDIHTALLERSAYCYFELSYTRSTMWMVWICTKCIDVDPNRKVIAQGQGETPEAAAQDALESFPKTPIADCWPDTAADKK